MATDIVMPNLGFDVQQARVIEWLKQPGDLIRAGETIAVVESDKANVELESIASGVVLEVLVPAGGEANVGATIARVGAATEQAISATTPLEISPLARKLAEENGIDLATLRGSGPRGRITREDVEAAIKQPPHPRPESVPALPLRQTQGAREGAVGSSKIPTSHQGTMILALPKVRKAAREAGIHLADVPVASANGVTSMADLQAYLQATKAQPTPTADTLHATRATQPGSTVGVRATPLSKIRQIIAKRMSESKREAPHFYVSGEFDLERALQRLNSLPEPRPGLNVLIQYLTVRTLRRVPELNATYQEETVYQYDAVNLAMAIARDEGLITPVLHGAERFSLEGMAQETRTLVERARANKLQPNDLQAGTFTISNLGVVRQVDQFTAILNPPQVAILAVGSVKPRPVVIDGGLHIRHTVHLTLSGDHRAVDGMHLARFLAEWQNELDNFGK